MLSKTDIANLALARLGVTLKVVDLDTDNAHHAQVIRQHFKVSLMKTLELHPWNFARQYQALPLVEENPGAGFRFSYDMPADALVVRRIAPQGFFSHLNEYNDQKLKWQQIYQGTRIRMWTNVPDAHAEYTTKVDEDSSFPLHFAEAVSCILAPRIAPLLITNNYSKVKDELLTTTQRDLNSAISMDMGHEPEKDDSLNPFLRARL